MKITEQDEKQLWMEIKHIFESGANEVRVFNMVKSFIEKRGNVWSTHICEEEKYGIIPSENQKIRKSENVKI